MDKIKQKDVKILKHLREDGRKSLTKISRQTKIPVTTIYERMKGHEGGLIRKHTCLIDFSLLGYEIMAKILLETDIESKNELAEFLVKHSQINSVHKISNGYDFLIEGIFREVSDVDSFIEKIESKYNIKNKKYFLVLEDLKREGFLTNMEN